MNFGIIRVMSEDTSTKGQVVLAKKSGSSRPAREKHGSIGWLGEQRMVYYVGHGWVTLVEKNRNSIRPILANDEAFVSRQSYVLAAKQHAIRAWRGDAGKRRHHVIFCQGHGWVLPDVFDKLISPPEPCADCMYSRSEILSD